WPGWPEGRAEVLGEPPADDHGSPGTRSLATAPYPSLLARLAAFPQAARFGAVALTITIWDARVTFVALIAGCVLAVTAELTGQTDDETAR
ncbi:hypothetical protein ACFQZ2_07990, partial [Streptomonospora algeriensis]